MSFILGCMKMEKKKRRNGETKRVEKFKYKNITVGRNVSETFINLWEEMFLKRENANH